MSRRCICTHQQCPHMPHALVQAYCKTKDPKIHCWNAYTNTICQYGQFDSVGKKRITLLPRLPPENEKKGLRSKLITMYSTFDFFLFKRLVLTLFPTPQKEGVALFLIYPRYSQDSYQGSLLAYCNPHAILLRRYETSVKSNTARSPYARTPPSG